MADVLNAKISGLYRGHLVAPSQCSSVPRVCGGKGKKRATMQQFTYLEVDLIREPSRLLLTFSLLC